MKVIPREPQLGWGLRRDYTRAPLEEQYAYIIGASHDGTQNNQHKTFRFSQREREWLEMIQWILKSLGSRSWIYQEGKQRSIWALETTHSIDPTTWRKQIHSVNEWNAYIRGYFDAEGGVPKQSSARFYIQFVQKNRDELEEIRTILYNQLIASGIVHNPSRRVDPNYWRFFIASRSHQRFMQIIGSWHPRKLQVFLQRMKI